MYLVSRCFLTNSGRCDVGFVKVQLFYLGIVSVGGGLIMNPRLECAESAQSALYLLVACAFVWFAHAICCY